jgi:hypothetical protein
MLSSFNAYSGFLVDIGSQTPKLGENPEEQDCPIGKKHLQKLLWLDLRNPVNFTDIDRHYFELLLEECEKRQYRSEWKVLIEKILEA